MKKQILWRKATEEEVLSGSPEMIKVSEEFVGTLEDIKNEKIQIIDEKTRQIIDRGFTFGGQTFSLSDNAQRNWIGIASGIAVGLYTAANFPFPLSTIDNKKYLLTWENRFNFLGQVSYVIGLNKTIGTELKQACMDATTIEELDAIVDTRQ